MGLLTPAAFLSALPALFDGTRSKGSLYLTIKRGACAHWELGVWMAGIV